MLKVGVFGVGHLGKFHLNNWKEIKDVKLIGFSIINIISNDSFNQYFFVYLYNCESFKDESYSLLNLL